MQFSFSGKWDYFLTMDTINKPCHCEPVLTLAWQSPGSSESYRVTLVIANQRRNAGVAIPQIEVKTTGLGSKMFENSGDCHASVRTGSQ